MRPSTIESGAWPASRAPSAYIVAACCGLSLLGALGCGNTVRALAKPDNAAVSWGVPVSFGDAEVNGTTLHYVRAGAGPVLIVLHGFPEDSSAYREILPRLSSRFSVIAPDLRGVGASAPSTAGLDIANVAEDIHQLAEQLGLERPFVVGHDIGGIVAYALARSHPAALRGVMLLDAPVPGLDPWDELTCSPDLWHFGFFQSAGLPEQLLLGREALFVREFLNGGLRQPSSVSDADAARYARAYTGTERLRAGLGFYRAFAAAEASNRAETAPTDLPLVVVGSDGGFAPLLPKLGAALSAHGWRSVASEVVQESGHYVLDEQPDRVSELIERYAG
jgi:pimeloyl-ACP methyl ester carboxylesterase